MGAPSATRPHPSAASAPDRHSGRILRCIVALTTLTLASCTGLQAIGSGVGSLWERASGRDPDSSAGRKTERIANRDSPATSPANDATAQRVERIFSPYRPTVQQGNYLTREQVDQLKEGMSRAQVQFLLGQPLLGPGFRDDRWEYVFRMQWADLRADTRRVTVHFDAQQRVVRVDADELPLRDDGQDPAVPGYRPPRGNER